MSVITLIAGVASDGAIGRNNELLWRLPEDLAHFKALTLGHPVVMGRKTWDSLPERFRPLPGRRNIVLSRQAGLLLSGAEVLPSLDAALQACREAPRVFVIGGAQIYAAALPLAQALELTEVEAVYPDADAHFPAWDRELFKQVSRESHTGGAGLNFHFTRYERKTDKAD